MLLCIFAKELPTMHVLLFIFSQRVVQCGKAVGVTWTAVGSDVVGFAEDREQQNRAEFKSVLFN